MIGLELEYLPLNSLEGCLLIKPVLLKVLSDFSRLHKDRKPAPVPLKREHPRKRFTKSLRVNRQAGVPDRPKGQDIMVPVD